MNDRLVEQCRGTGRRADWRARGRRQLLRSGVLAVLVVAFCFAKLCSPAQAAPPWASLVSFNQVEADPAKSYSLAESNGPWMIMASSFSGDGAEKQAQELALELRKRYKLEAYTHKAKFALGDANARGVDRFGNPIKARYQRGTQLEEYAVLVGNFKGVDDPEAQSTLQKLKYTQPKCLDVSETKHTNQSLAGLRMWVQAVGGGEKQTKGPMAHAFITTNPMLPKEMFAPNSGLDPLVLEMNRDVPHSLLNCPGKFTVVVATFKGRTIIEQKEISQVKSGKNFESELAEAAQKAHVLTEALRIKGYEAYEFHDRYASIVAVGSFDSVGSPRTDGKTEINPRIHAIMKTFGAEPINLGGRTEMKPKKMGPFPGENVGELFFDIQPMPSQVPQRSLAAVHNQNALPR